MNSWRTRLWSSVVLLLLVAGAVRAADWLLSPVLPSLLILAGLAGICVFVMRGR